MKKTAKTRDVGLLVLGMHRSGTSALTRMLNLLGAALPDDLLGGNASNPEGHWESQRVIDINDGLLAALGRRWDDIRDLPTDWLQRPETDAARDQIRAFIDRQLAGHRLWVLKEPRLCRLAPLWLEVLDEAGIDSRVIVPVRHPAEVAYSLARRDGIAPGRGHVLWMQHVLEAERASRGRPRALVQYDELMANWRAQAARLATGLSLKWPATVRKAGPEIDAMLKPALRHADVREERDAAARLPVPAPVLELYRALQADGEGDGDAWTRIQRVGNKLAQAGAVYGPGIADLAQRAERSEQRAAAVQLADPEAFARSLQTLEQLRADTQQTFAKLDQSTPLLAELVNQIEAQRAQLQALPGLQQQGGQVFAKLEQNAPLLAELVAQVEAQRQELQAAHARLAAELTAASSAGSAPTAEQVQLLAALRAQGEQVFAKLEQSGPLLAELIAQVEANRGALAPLPEGLAQVVNRLDQQAPLVAELINQIEAQRSALAPLPEGLAQVVNRLDQQSPLVAELINQVEAQRAALQPLPQDLARLHARLEQQGPLVTELIRQIEVQRDELGVLPQEVAQLAGALGQQAPLVTELVRQIQAQRDELQPLPENVAALFAKLDQQAPIVLELVRQVEAQRTELSPAMHASLRQLAQVQDEARQAFARLEAQAPQWQAHAQQLDALREESRQVFAKLDQTGPLLAELVAQVEAQRGAIDTVTSRWIKSPIVQELIRLVGQLHEQGHDTAARFDAERARLEQLSQELQGVGDRIEGSPLLQAQVQQLAHLREESQQLSQRLEALSPQLAELAGRVDARHDALAPAVLGLQQHLEQLRADNQSALAAQQQALADLDAQWRGAQSAQLARIEQDNRQVFAKLDQTAPLLAELIAQVEAQRGEIDGVTARWIRSPVVQEQLRLIDQVREQGQVALDRLDEASPRLDMLGRLAQAHGEHLERLAQEWTQARAAQAQDVERLTQEWTQARAAQAQDVERLTQEWTQAQRSELSAQLALQQQHLAEQSERHAQTQAQWQAEAAALRGAIATLEMVLADLRHVREGELARAAIVHNDLAVAQQRLDEIAAQVAARGEAIALRDQQLEASRVEIEELRTKAGGLESHVGALQAHVANLEAARGEMGSQLQSLQAHSGQLSQRLAQQEAELHRTLNSHSWKLTAPLRAARRVLFMPVGQVAAYTGGGLLRGTYRALPLSWPARLKLKAALFRTFAPVLRHTHAWQRWQAMEQGRWYLAPTKAGTARVEEPRAPLPPPVAAALAPAVVAEAAPNTAPAAAPVAQAAPRRVATPIKDGEYVPFGGDPVALAELKAKLIAFYLPQFHPIPENDAWWGKGFTEWTNVSKAVPQFDGHDQPHLPGELGFYDLRLPEVMHRQIELAKHYGVHGFCFHYYWFDGRRILEKPLNMFLADKTMDFPFAVCWANENWTRRWDGQDQDILLGQNHSPDSDLRFIRDIEPVLRDPRYIRVDGRPLLIVYRPSLLPDCRATLERWREYARGVGLGELFMVMVQFDAEDPRPFGFDAAVEFPPHKLARDLPPINATLPGLNPNFEGYVLEYQDVVDRAKNWPTPDFDLIRGVFPGWDNEARKPNRGYLFAHNTPTKYADWLGHAVDFARRRPVRGEPIVFVNAWNEWAEGAYLEPDRSLGYAFLQATRDVLTGGSEAGAQAPAPAALAALPAPEAARTRLVVVSHDAHPHGAQNLALHIVRELDRAFGYEVDLVLLGEGRMTPQFAEHATVHDAAAIRGDLDAMEALAAQLYAGGARAAIVNTTVSGLFAGVLKRAGFRVICLVHELPQLIADNGLASHARSIAQYADHVVFAAPQVRDGFATVAPVQPDKIVLRSQGLFTRSRYLGRNDNAQARAVLRARLGIAHDARIVLAVGYGDHRKGLDIFGEMAAELAERNPDLHFVWVGHYDEALMTSARTRLFGCGAFDRLHAIGLDFDTDDYYAGADVYALTSREDPFPSVVLEALAVGLPVVMFAGTGGAEQIVSRGCGVLVPELRASAFAAAVEALLGDRGALAAMAEQGRHLVEAEFNFRRYVFDLLRLAGIDPPRVSVVVPNYNYAPLMRARLESIAAQSLPAYEIIVLDDCSTDDSLEVLARLRGSLPVDFTVVPGTANSGSVFRQWRKGVDMAQGDFVWIAEADDLSAPEFLATALRPMLTDPRVAMSYCQSRQIDENGAVLAENYRYWTDDISPDRWTQAYVCDGAEEIRRGLSVKNTIPNVSAVLFRREPLRKVLDERMEQIARLRVAGDWLTYVALLDEWRVAYSPLSLNTHRRHTRSVTAAADQLPHLLEVLTVQKAVRDQHAPAPEVQAQAARYAQALYEQFGLSTESAPRVEQNAAAGPLLARDE